MGEVIKAKPMLKVSIRAGDVYYVDAKLKGQIEKDIAEKDVIRLNGDLVRTRDIVLPLRAVSGFDLDQLDKVQKGQVEVMIKQYKENLGTEPKGINIQIMIQRVLRCET